jgi:holo-ACP synthase CitX
MNTILDAREARAKHIESLRKEHPNKSVVILKNNVVGAEKNPTHMRFICAFFNDLVHRTFSGKIQLFGKQQSRDGNYCYYVINEVGVVVKERTIEIEEYNTLGRLIDLDVYYNKPISRQDLKCDMRKCLLCENYAHLCVRNKTHSEDEIHTKVRSIIESFIVDYLTNVTIKAIYSELELYPKFGLVSHRNSGCHTDMNYETFIRSTFAIRHDIEDYIKEGFKDQIQPKRLIEIGLQAEQHMTEATNGINTQKGLIFLLGIYLPALTKVILRNEQEDSLIAYTTDIANKVVGNYFETLTKDNATSNGDHIYLKHKLKGVRGEALNGLKLLYEIPSVVHHDDDIVHHEYLLYLMAHLNDTTIVHKTNLETLHLVQEVMKEMILNGGYKKNKDQFQQLSDHYTTLCISPGGSADMLVLKIIYEETKHLLAKLEINEYI